VGHKARQMLGVAGRREGARHGEQHDGLGRRSIRSPSRWPGRPSSRA
jgi:hypothetical protein